MKAVVDASICLCGMLSEPNAEKATKLSEDFRKGIHELLAPDLYVVEVGNGLLMAARKGKIQQAELPVMYADLMMNLPIVYQVLSLFQRAYCIAMKYPVSGYDAIYLALCEREGCPLITDDQKLIKAAPAFSYLTFNDL